MGNLGDRLRQLQEAEEEEQARKQGVSQKIKAAKVLETATKAKHTKTTK